jgi:hypothetical protein
MGTDQLKAQEHQPCERHRICGRTELAWTAFPPSEHRSRECNRVANWISLKTELETKNRGTQFGENAELWGVERGALRDAIFLDLELFDFHI